MLKINLNNVFVEDTSLPGDNILNYIKRLLEAKEDFPEKRKEEKPAEPPEREHVLQEQPLNASPPREEAKETANLSDTLVEENKFFNFDSLSTTDVVRGFIFSELLSPPKCKRPPGS